MIIVAERLNKAAAGKPAQPAPMAAQNAPETASSLPDGEVLIQDAGKPLLPKKGKEAGRLRKREE